MEVRGLDQRKLARSPHAQNLTLSSRPYAKTQAYEKLHVVAEIPHHHCSVSAARARGIMYTFMQYDLEAIAEGGEVCLDGMLRALYLEAAVNLRMRHPSFHCLCDLSISTSDNGMFGCLMYENRGVSSLSNLLDSDSPVIDLDSIKCIIYMLCYAVSALHSKDIAHLGICPSVVMLDENWVVKLGGLGGIKLPRHSTVGPDPPLHFCAPEMLQDKSSGSLASDIWSIGCIVAELTTRSALFHARDPAEQFSMITTVDPLTNELAIFSRRFTSIPEETVRFIRACLQLDPRNRADINELLKSNFLSPIAQACEATLATEGERVERIWKDFGSRSNRLTGLFNDYVLKLQELGPEAIGSASQEVRSLPSEFVTERKMAPTNSPYPPAYPEQQPDWQPQMQSQMSYQPQMQGMPSYQPQYHQQQQQQPQMSYQPHPPQYQPPPPEYPPPQYPPQGNEYDNFRYVDESSSVGSQEFYEVAKGLLANNGSPATKGPRDPKMKAKMSQLDDILEDKKSSFSQPSKPKGSGSDDVNLMQARQRRKDMIARQKAQENGGGGDNNPFVSEARSEGSVLGRQQSVMGDAYGQPTGSGGGGRKTLDYVSTKTRETFLDRRTSDSFVGSPSAASAAARAVAAIDRELAGGGGGGSGGGLGNMRLPSITPQKSSIGIVTALPVVRTASNVNFHSPQGERVTLNHIPERTPSMMGSGASFVGRQRTSDFGGMVPQGGPYQQQGGPYQQQGGFQSPPVSSGPSFQVRRQASSMTGNDHPSHSQPSYQPSRMGQGPAGVGGGQSILGSVGEKYMPSYFSQRGSNSILSRDAVQRL